MLSRHAAPVASGGLEPLLVPWCFSLRIMASQAYCLSFAGGIHIAM